MTCPCGSGTPLEGCCGRYLHAGLVPETAEQLMRSRYTAYTLQDVDYLVETQVDTDREAVAKWASEAEFTGLQVRDATEDEVEFVATWRVGSQVHQHHERSRFERRGGWWIYVDGRAAQARPKAAAGRNDPCPCGSGRKHKKCCG